MCGVVMFVGHDLPSRSARDRALRLLEHRGPDAFGELELPGVWLGHRRLSILDPTPGANQPMTLDRAGLAIVYNGEIYNHRDLRLPSEGYRTGSDTESLLHAWARSGTDCLAGLDGIFGCGIVEPDGGVVVARDRMGVKPLYLQPTREGCWIASEIKALPVAEHADADTARAMEFLRYQAIAGQRTLFKGVTSLPPGSFTRIRPGGDLGNIESFWRLDGERLRDDYRAAERWSPREARRRLEETLVRGIESQMLSDVPIGTLCSGGVDSSLVTAVVQRKQPDVQIFAVDFEEAGFSERPFIEEVARKLEIRVSYARLDRPAFLANLVDCIYHNDLPLSHANSVGIYLVSALARSNGVKVLLTGEGADELFGGYESYQRLMGRLRWHYRLRPLGSRLARRLRTVLREPVEQRDDSLLRSSDADLAELAHGSLARTEARRDARAAWRFIPDPIEREVLAAMSADLQEYLEPILQRQDRMSMMAGVESRVPFLSNGVVDFAASLPLTHRVGPKGGKLLLKEVARVLLPSGVVDRPKIGFRVPLQSWIRLRSADLFRNGFVEEALGGRVADGLGGIPPSLRFVILNLELWGRIFVRGEDRGELTERLLADSDGLRAEDARQALRLRGVARR